MAIDTTWLRIIGLAFACGVGLWALIQPTASPTDHRRLVLGPSSPTAPAADPTPLVGICIVGGARAVSATWESVWEQGIESLQPDPARRRVLIETTLSTKDCDANPMNAGDVAHKCRQEVEASAALLHSPDVTNHPTRKFDLHVDDALTSCDHPFAAKHECCKNATAGAERMADPPRGVWGLRQYLRKAQCSDRLMQMENETGVRFDVVAWVRPDLYLFERFPSAIDIVRMKRPRVLVGSKEGGAPIGDYIFVAPRPLKWAWHRALYDVLGSEGCPASAGGRAPENRLDDLARANKIPVQIHPFIFAIARSNRSADCFRLKNEVMSRVSVVADESHELISPQELCTRRFPG